MEDLRTDHELLFALRDGDRNALDALLKRADSSITTWLYTIARSFCLKRRRLHTPCLDCPDLARMFSQHLEGQITADLCTKMKTHLDQCLPCRAACGSLQKVLAVCRTAPRRGARSWGGC